jgi:hypothetical protein
MITNLGASPLRETREIMTVHRLVSAKRIGFSGFFRKPENKKQIQEILEILSKKTTYKIESIP